MKRIFLLAFALALPAARAGELPPLGPEPSLPPMQVIQSTTREGLALWVAPRPGVPKACVFLAVRGGGSDDPPALEGVSELFADTLAEGTKTRSAPQIAEELQAVGAQLEADWNADGIFLAADGLSSGTGRMIEILADIARNAAFPEDEVALVKSNLEASLAERESTPEFVGDKAFAEALFGAHPYRVTHATRAVLAAATAPVLRRELGRRFRPERTLLVVVGDVDPAAVSRDVAAAFAGWSASGPLPTPPPAPSASSARRIFLVDRPGSTQSHLVIGRLAPVERDPRYLTATVGATLFGGMGSARLMENLREDKGYSYSPFSALTALARAGVLELVADVRTEVTGESLAETFRELDRMAKTPPSKDELARAKRYETGTYLMRNQVQQALATTLAHDWILGLSPEALSEFPARVDAVTLDDVRRLGRELFPALTQTVVVVGDAARVAKALARFGEVKRLEP
jgi:zinc protease